MQSQTPMLLIVYAILSLVGWILIACGFQDLRDYKRFRHRTTGVVTGIVRTETMERRGRGARRHHELVTRYYAVVEYRVDEHFLRVQCGRCCPKDEYAVGETIDVLYDDDDPRQFLIERSVERGRGFTKWTFVIGIAWVILAWIIAVNIYG